MTRGRADQKVPCSLLLVVLPLALFGCASMGDASWAAPVPRNRTRVDLAGAAALAKAPYRTELQHGITPEVEIGFERGLSDSVDVHYGVRGIALSRMGLIFGGKGLLFRRKSVEGSLGLLASGYWLPVAGRILGAIDLGTPLRLGWNLSPTFQLGIGASIGLRYEHLRTFFPPEVGRPLEYVQLQSLRPVFGFTLALYSRAARWIHVVPTVEWATVYGTDSVLFPANGSSFIGGLHVHF